MTPIRVVLEVDWPNGARTTIDMPGPPDGDWQARLFKLAEEANP